MKRQERRIHWPAYKSRDPFRTFCGKVVAFKYIVPEGEDITCVSCQRKRAQFDANALQRGGGDPDVSR